jgi:hypothetical protein
MAVGGAAYLVSKAIKAAKVVAFEDLGMEAIYEFTVQDMPVTVAVDSTGTSVHQTGPARMGRHASEDPGGGGLIAPTMAGWAKASRSASNRTTGTCAPTCTMAATRSRSPSRCGSCSPTMRAARGEALLVVEDLESTVDREDVEKVIDAMAHLRLRVDPHRLRPKCRTTCRAASTAAS